ncbi:MAG TPA: hypothetical protein VFC78_00285 [Tepidisphaeraceae bacterium]|nr:hypothetical protein [Tepidisphaeraceae bacterium]
MKRTLRDDGQFKFVALVQPAEVAEAADYPGTELVRHAVEYKTHGTSIERLGRFYGHPVSYGTPVHKADSSGEPTFIGKLPTPLK